MILDRRQMLMGSGALGAAALVTGSAQARVLPRDMEPLIGPGYRPTDLDERSMWEEMERVEEEIAGSNLLVDDPDLNAYLRGLIAKVGGPAAGDMRIYLARIPEFNAMMFPTGFTVFFSGLLLRMKNEAQLAGVIAHESAHFLRKHQIRQWRSVKRKSDIFALLAMGAGAVGGVTGTYMGDLMQLGRFATIMSILSYSRELEAEADAMGARLLAEAGYDPMVMPETWQQLIAELDQSAHYRGRNRERRFAMFGTHPSPERRMKDLTVSAKELRIEGRDYARGREQYDAALGEARRWMLEDQVKLNDPGASQYVVETLAEDGWNGQLRFSEAEIWRLRGRPGDFQRAARGYATATLYPDVPPEAWRWHGIALHREGRNVEAADALRRYLMLAPDAPDAEMIRAMAGGME
ncbi:M48 family metallopeptidase [Sphingomicrobium lutaoense]|uniref:Putative Zn-dependent protease n=1 Tax=Sphingomicrobium lutaoense TaxID=515949 RepID=A0A839YTG1_9SPHN|nr:M48 family metallopeptidase [Sphingomicrobium lutaoense]MBB3763561.1 putative Zn-dependent protease [Sphingomicrobium lutaoense]